MKRRAAQAAVMKRQVCRSDSTAFLSSVFSFDACNCLIRVSSGGVVMVVKGVVFVVVVKEVVFVVVVKEVVFVVVVKEVVLWWW